MLHTFSWIALKRDVKQVLRWKSNSPAFSENYDRPTNQPSNQPTDKLQELLNKIAPCLVLCEFQEGVYNPRGYNLVYKKS